MNKGKKKCGMIVLKESKKGHKILKMGFIF